MKILISINHPAHVHVFKNFIWEMLRRDSTVLVTARNKDVTLDLLGTYNLDYVLISNAPPTLFSIYKETLLRTLKFLSVIREFEPDISISQMDPSLAFASKLMGVPYICTADTEHATAALYGALPFTKAVLTPSCFKKKIGPKQVLFNSYKELAYLHPKYFTPNPTVLKELNLTEVEHFIIVRFVSWNATHDIGQHGIHNKVEFVKVLEHYGRVLITSEGALPPELQSYQIQISPEKLHTLLYYATLYVGEGGTTATEAAVLGTPSIFVSTLTGTMGNFIELEETYDLLYSYNDSNAALDKAIEILRNSESKEEWRIKRERLLKEKIDLTAFMIWFVENYPASFNEKSNIHGR